MSARVKKIVEIENEGGRGRLWAIIYEREPLKKEMNTCQHSSRSTKNNGVTFFGASGPLRDQHPRDEHVAL